VSAPRDLTRWAPFTVDEAFASMAPVRLKEDPADLARSLPAATTAAPYRWAFGDGSIALGHSVVHRYRHPGIYKITIWGRYSLTAGAWHWLPFDSVLLRIVPPEQVVRANLGYWLLSALQFLFSEWVWGCDALLLLLIGAAVFWPWFGGRHRRRSASPARPATPWYD
jgi:hypothetical protein